MLALVLELIGVLFRVYFAFVVILVCIIAYICHEPTEPLSPHSGAHPGFEIPEE